MESLDTTALSPALRALSNTQLATSLPLLLPASVLVTYGIYRSVAQSIAARFYIPWYSVAIAVGSVFAVVFATMLYATGKIRKENTVDALKNENL